jgi:hypothetical protein
MLRGELGCLVRQVGVRGPGAAAREADAEALRALLDRSGRVARQRPVPGGLSPRRSRWVEEVGGEGDVELVLLLQPLDLNETDVAPRSDEIRKDQQRDRLGIAVHAISIGLPQPRFDPAQVALVQVGKSFEVGISPLHKVAMRQYLSWPVQRTARRQIA